MGSGDHDAHRKIPSRCSPDGAGQRGRAGVPQLPAVALAQDLENQPAGAAGHLHPSPYRRYIGLMQVTHLEQLLLQTGHQAPRGAAQPGLSALAIPHPNLSPFKSRSFLIRRNDSIRVRRTSFWVEARSLPWRSSSTSSLRSSKNRSSVWTSRSVPSNATTETRGVEPSHSTPGHRLQHRQLRPTTKYTLI
jgi:hypothetical protein